MSKVGSLGATPPGEPLVEVTPTPESRQAGDVEVALVEDDAAGEAAVGVDADAEEQAAGVGLLDVDAQVLEGGVGRVVDDLDVGAVEVEDVEALEVDLGGADVGVGEDL